MTPAPSGERVNGTPGELTGTEYWDHHWRRLAATNGYSTFEWMRRSYPYRSLDRLLRSVLPVDPQATFIELGSGPARWMIYFHRTFGYRVYGCDDSPVSCILARENLAKAGVDGQIDQADFFKIAGSYDVVFSAGVIEHFDDPTVPLAAFARLVRPGGILITDVPNLGGLNGLYRRWLKPETFQTHRLIRLAALRRWHRHLGLSELLATCYGSFCLTRVPADAFAHRPRIQRFVWAPAYRAASGGLNRAHLALHRLGVRVDHPLISPHLLVVARAPRETAA